ncbi:MAG TPA: aromatic ring-hydroxylating dioxygenase subunit alpha [Vicinamibacterales bacterium]|nr:aromatic ring-hydroxylating dioxygenase subunit alpha [Vicinamibacterales bacterium]
MSADASIQPKPRATLPSDAVTLPARYYTDPEIFAREMERFYFRMWICAGRAAEIPRAGDFFVREAVGESVVIARGEDGRVRAFYNTCRHRGTKYCEEEQGHFAGRIQCPYHLWTYRLDGTLANAPHMNDVPHFRKEDLPLLQVACEDWDGHLFLNFGTDPPPLASQLAALPAKFAAWRMQDLRRAARCVYDLQTNWKLVLLNYSECLHCPNVHPQLNQLSHYLSGENEPLQPTYMGGRMDLRPGVETMSTDGVCRRACLPGLPEEDRRRVYYYALLPNLLLSLHPDYMMTHTLWPLAADRTRIICEWHFHPDEIARPGFDAQDVVAFWDMTNRQDWHLCELSQAGISSRGYRPGPYSNREDLLHQFDRFIVRELGEP